MPSTPPTWALALLYWIHFLATVAWFGSLAAISILVLPASNRTLEPADRLRFTSALQKRLEPIAWFSMGLLVVTGLFQMSANEHYNGFLSISTQWSLAILVKHSIAVILVVVSAIHTWEVLPAIQRTLMKKDKAAPEELIKLEKRETTLLRISLFLAALILIATAVARSA
ncbi:MAG: CopD family protein [Chloroflexota bacterium]